jgi:signal transduction histidine kinase
MSQGKAGAEEAGLREGREAASAAQSPSPPQEERVNILLVDDLPEKLMALESLLTDPVFNLVKSTSGQDALRQLLRDDFALILLDVNMPSMDGFETATLVRQRRKTEHIPIIFITAHSDDDERMTKGYSLGAVDFIFAPVVPEILRAKVNVFVDLYRINRKVRQQAWALQSYTVSLELANRTLAQRSLELQSSKDSFRAIVEKNAEGIAVVDQEGAIRFANSALGSFLGQPPAVLLGRPFPFPLQDAQSPLEIRLEGRDGPAWAELMVWETQWEGCKAALAVLRDVTPRRRAEEALRHSEEKLRQAQKLESIGRLAGGVAHDFNNLLTAINGYSELVLATLDEDSPIKPHMEEIRRSGERAAVLTHQLLAYSRKQVLIPKPLFLNHVVEGMAKMLRRLIGENIALETRLDAGMGMVKADLGQLEQAIMNLVVNAKDAMPGGGRIMVSTGYEELAGESEAMQPLDPEMVVSPGRYAFLSVEDTGHGMDEVTRARIFEPFFTTKDVGQGTGLGLSMVYGFVKQSGGNITVSSTAGCGSCFRLYLPVAAVAESEPSAPGSVAEPLPTRGEETILLVEDEASVRNFLRSVLARDGYRVLEAGDGVAALDLAQRHDGPIHLLLTDLMMANMGGRELALRMAELRSNLLVLFMSGYAEEAVLPHEEIREGRRFLQKPFSPATLARKVRELLDTARGRREPVNAAN